MHGALERRPILRPTWVNVIEMVTVEDFPRFRDTSAIHSKKMGRTVLGEFQCKRSVFARRNGRDMDHLLGRGEVR